MRRLLFGSLLLSLVCVLPGFGQSLNLVGSDGNVYGATGSNLYSYSPTTGTYTVISLSEQVYGLCLERSDGTFLGQAYASTGYYQLVKVTFAGQITVLAQFPGKSDGPGCPSMANDGNYYGAAEEGGDYNAGYLYQLTAAGQLNIFYSFTGGSDGSGTSAAPIQASNGDLYDYSIGNLIRYSPTTGLAVYAVGDNLGYEAPIPLMEGPDGNFYTVGYDAKNVVQVQPTGTSTIIYTPPTDSVGDPGSISAVYLTGSTSAPLAAMQGNYYTNESSFDECYADGNYFSLVALSLTGTNSGTLYAIGYDESQEGGEYGDGDYYYYSLIFGGNGSLYGQVTDTTYTDDGEGDCGDYSNSYNVDTSTSVTPMTMSLSTTRIPPKGSATVTWQVNNAFSDTMKQCYGYGLLSGALSTSGSKTVTAPGSGNYVTSIICGGTETDFVTLVAGAAALSLSSSASVAGVGSPITLTATVTNAQTPAPTGKVNFLYNNTLIGSANLVNNVATLTASTAGVPAGTYIVTAQYAGDAHYGAATSNSIGFRLIPRLATTLGLTPASQTVLQGGTATFTATAAGTSPNGAPSGKVSFLLGSTVLATETLSTTANDMAQAILSEATAGVPTGTYSITASYSGDEWNLPSRSSAATVTIGSTTPVTLAISPNPVPAADSFTLTATIKGKDNPSGTVIFYVNTTQDLASATVGSGGVAAVTLPSGTLAAGTYQVTAYYAGDTNNPSGTSPAVSLTIQ
jgi:hypothetical protein